MTSVLPPEVIAQTDHDAGRAGKSNPDLPANRTPTCRQIAAGPVRQIAPRPADKSQADLYGAAAAALRAAVRGNARGLSYGPIWAAGGALIVTALSQSDRVSLRVRSPICAPLICADADAG